MSANDFQKVPLQERISELEEVARGLKKTNRYQEALKKYDELYNIQKDQFGDHNEETIKTGNEIAIICNILSMVYLQKE